MSLTVLSVPFPFARVTQDSVGGAEQMLTYIERALLGAGHRSIIVARADSEVSGELVPIKQRELVRIEQLRRPTQASA